MGRYVYCGDQGDETWCGYTHLQCYMCAETGEEVSFTSREDDMAFFRSNEIISWEEYYRIRDEKEYGQVINNYLKNRNWHYIIEPLGLDIEKILEKCILIQNEDDCVLTRFCGVFPSRIFEIGRLLETKLADCHDEDVLTKLKWVINYLKLKEEEIFIDLAKGDLEKSNRTDVLNKINDMYRHHLINSHFGSPLFREVLKDFLLEFDAKEKDVISRDVISDLQNSELAGRLLLSFYEYYDFNSLTRKQERNYPLYCGINVLECLAFESIQYPHYVKWQNERKDTRVKDAVISPMTINLLNKIYTDEALKCLFEVAKKVDVEDLNLESPRLNVPSRRLVLSDSFVQFDSDNMLTFED